MEIQGQNVCMFLIAIDIEDIHFQLWWNNLYQTNSPN